MKKFIILILTLLMCAPVVAKTKSKKRSVRSKKSRLVRYLGKNFFQAGLDYTIWNEQMDITDGVNSGVLPSAFKGLRLHGSYQIPKKRSVRWVYGITGALQIGTFKGSATNGMTDILADQLWTSVGIEPGISYRSSLRTEFGIRIPVVYRMLSLDLAEGSSLTTDRDTSLSYGLSLVMISRLTLKSSIIIGLTHHHEWQASQWSLGWQYDFR